MTQRRILTGIVCALCISSLVACNASSTKQPSTAALHERLHSTLHRHDNESVHVSARVVELPSGRELYSDSAMDPMIPASNMKLLVTAAALDFFGPDHGFPTYLIDYEENLWIVGTGDPAVGDAVIAARRGGDTLTVLDDWADAVRARWWRSSGPSEKIQIGKLYYYEGAFEDDIIHSTWARDDLVNWYAAPISGLNFNDNCIDVTIWPTEPGKPVRYEVMPPTQSIKIINNCITAAKGDPEIQRAQNENVYTLSGGCTKRTTLRSKPVTDPGAFFADAFRTHLLSKGIEVKSIERVSRPPFGSTSPPQEIVIATHVTTVRELLPRINKPSQNLITEGLIKLLGRAYDQQRWRPAPGSWSSGSDAVMAFLAKMDIDSTGIVVADGSGLSRDNRVTTYALSEVLVKMKSHPYGEVFYESLSIGGVDGTIRNRFTDRLGKVHAKTGYIGGVRSLSGYAPARDGKTIAFSIIYNGIKGPVKRYEELQDEAVRILMSWPDLNYVAPPSTQPATTQAATAPATNMAR